MAHLDLDTLEKLRRMTGARFPALAGMYIDNAAELLGAAEAGLAAGDLGAVTRAAHALKSASGQLGVFALQHTMETLEEQTAGGEAQALAPLLDQARAEYEEARRALIAFMENKGA